MTREQITELLKADSRVIFIAKISKGLLWGYPPQPQPQQQVQLQEEDDDDDPTLIFGKDWQKKYYGYL